MATVKDVQRIALSLPETDEHPSYGGQPSFRVKKKGFAYLRQDSECVALHVADLEEKEMLLASDAKKFCTTPHYDGYAMVLVRYGEVDTRELRELLTDSWRLKAQKRVLAAFEAAEAATSRRDG